MLINGEEQDPSLGLSMPAFSALRWKTRPVIAIASGQAGKAVQSFVSGAWMLIK